MKQRISLHVTHRKSHIAWQPKTELPGSNRSSGTKMATNTSRRSQATQEHMSSSPQGKPHCPQTWLTAGYFSSKELSSPVSGCPGEGIRSGSRSHCWGPPSLYPTPSFLLLSSFSSLSPPPQVGLLVAGVAGAPSGCPLAH